MQLIDIQSQLDEFATNNIHLEILDLVKSGKEATVYRVRNQEDSQIMALKVYKSHEMRSFRQNADYLAGLHIGSRTLRQAVKKKTKIGRKYIQDVWVDQEYRMLRKLNSLNANVPEVYGHSHNAILFEYIGGDNPAPKLAEVRLTATQAQAAFNDILDNIELMLQAGYVHGDLSAFNILYWQDQVVIIDFPQAADIIKNANSYQMLLRDIENIAKYFQKYLPINTSEIQERFSVYNDLFRRLV